MGLLEFSQGIRFDKQEHQKVHVKILFHLPLRFVLQTNLSAPKRLMENQKNYSDYLLVKQMEVAIQCIFIQMGVIVFFFFF